MNIYSRVKFNKNIDMYFIDVKLLLMYLKILLIE